MYIPKKFAQAACALALLSLPASAAIDTWHQGSFADNYVNFASTQQWNTRPDGSKYYTTALTGIGNGSTTGSCYLIRFTTGGLSAAATDIRLWTNGGTSIDDDGPNGSRLPRARVWLAGSTPITVAAYDPSFNTVDFHAIAEHIYSNGTAAACDDGVTPLWNVETDTILRAGSFAN